MTHPLHSVMPDGPIGQIAEPQDGIETGLGSVFASAFSGGTEPTGPAGTAIVVNYATGPTGPTGAPMRKPLHGGEYTDQNALAILNAHYLIGKSEYEVAIYRIRDD